MTISASGSARGIRARHSLISACDHISNTDFTLFSHVIPRERKQAERKGERKHGRDSYCRKDRKPIACRFHSRKFIAKTDYRI
jgi:hypothetical protein